MQRSIYTLSKSLWNNFGYVSKDATLKSKASTRSGHALQNKNHSNRNSVEIYTHQPIRRRVKEKTVNVERVPDKKQNFTSKISIVSKPNSTIKHRSKTVKSKDFIKENIANVAKKSNQIKDISNISISSIVQCKSRNSVKENIVNAAKQSSKIEGKGRISKRSADRVTKTEATISQRGNMGQNRKKLIHEIPICSSTELHFASGIMGIMSHFFLTLASCPSSPSCLVYSNPKALYQYYKNEWNYFRENIPGERESQKFPPSTCINENIETWIGRQNRRTVRQQALKDLDTSSPRPTSITRVRKLANADPVSLYEYYRNEWNYFRQQIPGEGRRMQWHTNLLNQ
uniref:Uncharacterized protein n=1 Tax=Glossina austeni TaxID=7395 RepID=A0A1A9VCD7_GLOAU